MSKITKKSTRQPKKPEKGPNTEIKTLEYLDYLLELHKLQGALLTHLSKEIKPDD